MPISCPLCRHRQISFFLQAQDTEKLSARPYNYYQCDYCRVIFLFPVCSKKELKRFYQGSYFSGRKLVEFFQWERRIKIEKLKKKARILDFGCGEGIFLSWMKRGGWEVSGADISKEAAQTARRRFGLKVLNSPLADDSFIHGNYAVITLWQTLEHLPQPLPVLKFLNSFLANDGFLMISVPNIDSLEAKIGGSRWFHLDPPRHCFHYNLESLSFLLKKAGFAIISTDYFSLEYNFPSLWQTILNRLGSAPNFFYHYLKRQPILRLSKREYFYSLFITLFGGLVIFFPALIFSFILSYFRQSGSLTVFAQKKVYEQE